jgi:hypothetical protein
MADPEFRPRGGSREPSDPDGSPPVPHASGPAPPGSGEGLDRSDLDRVIRRAVELQFQEADDREGETVSEAEVLRIGREVGVDEKHLRRALGELRAESLVPVPVGERPLLERHVGPGTVQASRVVPGEAREVEAKLAEHFRAGESLTRIRSRQGRSHWEPAEGFLAELQRGFRWKGQRYDLARAAAVDLTVVSLEEGYALVIISVDLRKSRSESFFGHLGVSGGVGAAAGVGVGMIVAGGWVVALPGAVVGAVVGGVSGRNAHQKEVKRLHLAMEGILDRLETGEPLARKGQGILGAAGIRPPLPPG